MINSVRNGQAFSLASEILHGIFGVRVYFFVVVVVVYLIIKLNLLEYMKGHHVKVSTYQCYSLVSAILVITYNLGPDRDMSKLMIQ